MKRLFIFLAFITALSGCTHIDSSHVLTGPPAAPTSQNVRIVMEGQEAPPGYTEVAILEGRGNARAGMTGVLSRLKSDAQAIGANGIVNVRVDQGGSVISITGVAVRY